MSFSDKPEMPRWARGIVVLLILAGMLFSLGNVFVWFMGPCPAFSSNTACEWSEAKTAWLFPVSQIATVVGIAMAVRILKKWTIK